ncbi:ABC-2 type transport system ATP-binding protein [Acetitomaculum ruminis DSM 5522]|uniref:ABC-2 type transport system ATP-binding protein n=1 Tax=Acetitomaculum ruminis DSM 5522 TaxID=1120918 RepID=A0A1I0ZY89_9FIRM|nr:ABC transporter ATP-binding protein [Acetitomaculum ruminis]SFB30745.1 ABC-2 type transport system ATP-binding protein [Acetitomaculum ruminis DSM 5522]
MSIIEVCDIVKKYPSFELKNASFGIEGGEITGFIGRNGAGKTTTIKTMLNLIHLDGGKVSYFGKNLTDNEVEIKKRIGYSTGTLSWYPRKKIKDIAGAIKPFYESWDEESYRKYLNMFGLDEMKMPVELSEGMKVKFNLLIALSHRAEVLILDEPTSGLDPFSRNELLDVFEELKKQGVAVFFSTHIISDIEKCADTIVYISKGNIVAALSKNDFVKSYSKKGESLEDTILRMESEGGATYA